MPRSILSWLLLAAALVALVGCAEKEQIQSYTVPRPSIGDPKVKLMVAIFDVGDRQQWYFKLLGPTEEVDAHAAAFVTFVESVRFLPASFAPSSFLPSFVPIDPVVWTAPPTWEKGQSRGDLRYAAFYPNPKNHALELTVARLDRQSPLLENVNRWCDNDLGRPHLRHRDLALEDRNADLIGRISAGNQKGLLVKLVGPGSKRIKRPMRKDSSDPHEGLEMFAGAGKGGAKLPFTYTVPQGWIETGPRQMVANSFLVRDGGRAASAEISSLGANFGDPLENHNRWRKQVGLAPANVIDPRATSIKVSGVASDYYDFVGTDKRMLLVVARRGQQTWFFKLIGDARVVADNRGKFESFVKSVKFPGAAE